MRQGITVQVSEDDRVRLGAIVADRNSPQKHVWRARIVLMTADGIGTNTIMRQTGKSKVTVWRWRERFMAQGVDWLLRDKTRPLRIPRLPATVHERTVALTLTDPPGEVTHWTAPMMAAGRDQRQLTASSYAPDAVRRRRQYTNFWFGTLGATRDGQGPASVESGSRRSIRQSPKQIQV